MKSDGLEGEKIIRSTRGGFRFCEKCQERFSDFYEYSDHMKEHREDS